EVRPMRRSYVMVTAFTLLFAGLLCLLQALAQIIGGGVWRGGRGSSYVGPLDVVGASKICASLRACSAALAGTKVANICNSGDANCADLNSLANGDFDVTTAQGSPLNWGGAGGTCTIKWLYNQPAGLNCSGGTTCDMLNNTAANRPTLVFNCF